MDHRTTSWQERFEIYPDCALIPLPRRTLEKGGTRKWISIKDGGRCRLASLWVNSVRIFNQLSFMQLLVVRQM